MRTTWLLLDATQLAWAAFHTTGGLHYNSTPTGVIYGTLAMVLRIQREFPSAHLVFCFDHGRSHRYALLPSYKGKRQERREADPKERAAHSAVCQQIAAMKSKHLPAIGFKNVLYYKGYEADDLIASVAYNLPDGDLGVIVSSDHDMFQILRPNVSIYNPYKDTWMNEHTFRDLYGISPKRWIAVKSLAGCSSDNIPGIVGVGETSAVKYLRGDLKEDSVYYRRIEKGIADGILATNRPLVKLPYEGTPSPRLHVDDKLNWGPTMKHLGIKTLDPEPEFSQRRPDGKKKSKSR